MTILLICYKEYKHFNKNNIGIFFPKENGLK